MLGQSSAYSHIAPLRSHRQQGQTRHKPSLQLGIFIRVNYDDLTVLPHLIIVSKGNDPQMAELFRLVKYYNLPRFIHQPLFWGLRSLLKREFSGVCKPCKSFQKPI